ncbi:hypothetical protein NQ314_021202, partial [Rhamnusium bicolor]
ITAMVTSDTGLPDPDNPNNDLRVSNEDVILVTDDDEDSDDQETVTLDDYQPLPMEDTGDSNYCSTYGYQTPENTTTSSARRRTPMEEVVVATFKQVWNECHPSEGDIEMDSKKIDEVKEAMSKITLPPSSIPEWANSVPEDEWKKHLLNRLQTNQEEKK